MLPRATCGRSKVDAAAFAFPIAESCRLKAGWAANLLRFDVRHGLARLTHLLRLAGLVIAILGRILHRRQVCQNSPAGTTINLWKNNAEAHMHDRIESIALDDLGALRLRGSDAQRFLQGQVSSDVERLAAARTMLAGYHNPQGRTIALLRLILIAPDEVLAILPRELAAVVCTRLSKFILRAKVKVDDVSADLHIQGLIATDDAEPLPESAATCVRIADAPARWLSISAAAGKTASSGDREKWRSFDVAGGVPQVYAATSEEFVAQMLNLDALGAIDFDKGCYTGQEVIARAHYRGRVKRRMQRFVTYAALDCAPATSGLFTDGRAFKIVEAVKRSDGACEFLAVCALSARDEAQADSASLPVEVTPLALPYSLPE